MEKGQNYSLSVTTHKPRGARGSGGKSANIGIDIVEITPTIDPESEADDLLILEHAPTVLLKLSREMLDAGFILRLDLARSARYLGSWPARCATYEEVITCIDAIVRSIGEERHRSVYPISVWGLPAESERRAEKAIDVFSAIPGDAALLAGIVTLGVSRIVVFPSSITLSVPPNLLEVGLSWVRAATAATPLPVDWA